MATTAIIPAESLLHFEACYVGFAFPMRLEIAVQPISKAWTAVFARTAYHMRSRAKSGCANMVRIFLYRVWRVASSIHVNIHSRYLFLTDKFAGREAEKRLDSKFIII